MKFPPDALLTIDEVLKRVRENGKRTRFDRVMALLDPTQEDARGKKSKQSDADREPRERSRG